MDDACHQVHHGIGSVGRLLCPGIKRVQHSVLQDSNSVVVFSRWPQAISLSVLQRSAIVTMLPCVSMADASQLDAKLPARNSLC